MEIKKYRLQTEMENLKEGNEEWFKDYVEWPQVSRHKLIQLIKITI